MNVQLLHGNCIDKMRELPENSVDSIITDPPYELGFMGKSWDSTGIANDKNMWAEALRVLKPGGHLLAFGGTRTYHRMAVAIESAGFEVRDMIEWVYSTGFPKSLNIGKAVDSYQQGTNQKQQPDREITGIAGKSGADRDIMNYYRGGEYYDTVPATEAGKQWEGWGTALKPAHEPICMARKPLSEKTVAENVLKHGTGGINIDISRVVTDENLARPQGSMPHPMDWGNKSSEDTYITNGSTLGRFPANLIHDNSEEVRECFPENKSSNAVRKNNKGDTTNWRMARQEHESFGFADSGNASRFFKSIVYVPKASKSERNKGCEGLEEKDATKMDGGTFKSASTTATERTAKNNHPTIKPIALMEYLINMVTPKGGTVLDPFMGSGTTGVACRNTGRSFIGIEIDPEYMKIAEARINSVDI